MLGEYHIRCFVQFVFNKLLDLTRGHLFLLQLGKIDHIGIPPFNRQFPLRYDEWLISLVCCFGGKSHGRLVLSRIDKKTENSLFTKRFGRLQPV